MKNKIGKVLLLHTQNIAIREVKDVIFHALPLTLFITANSESTFQKKLDWMRPDVIVSNISCKDFSRLKTTEEFKTRLRNIPIIFILEKAQVNPSTKRYLQEANSFVLQKELDQLPRHIEDVLQQNFDSVKKRHYKYQDCLVQLNKALTILGDDTGMEKKQNLVLSLEKIQDNLAAAMGLEDDYD